MGALETFTFSLCSRQESACRHRSRYHRGKALCLLIFGVSLIVCYGIECGDSTESGSRASRFTDYNVLTMLESMYSLPRRTRRSPGRHARFVVMGNADDGMDDRHALCIARLVRRCDADMGIHGSLSDDGLGSTVLLLQAGRGSFPPDIATPSSRRGVLQRRRSPEPVTMARAASGRAGCSRIVAFLCHRRQCVPHLFHDESGCAIPTTPDVASADSGRSRRVLESRGKQRGHEVHAGFLTFPHHKERVNALLAVNARVGSSDDINAVSHDNAKRRRLTVVMAFLAPYDCGVVSCQLLAPEMKSQFPLAGDHRVNLHLFK